MKLISHDLQDGGKLPNRHVFNGMGYDGDNISPHLMWDDVPAGTKSFVVTCYDPDAPTGSGWWHWVVVNLPADTRVLPQGAGSGQAELPEEAVQTRTDFGKAGYGGVAPVSAAPPGRLTLLFRGHLQRGFTHARVPHHRQQPQPDQPG
ncbi:MAG: YbhB/YbcL family Raf kinase inhibitor-like protein [Klebsiella variicola]|nr:YbhB/YbcL family Raf kinase inhibitor-like protein [Klebsiella variicola]